MNILRIISKEFKINIRNYKANLMMVFFPIVLIIILGAAFTSSFDRTIKLDNVNVLYTEKTAGNHYLTDAFKSFREGMTKDYGMKFQKIDDINAGTEKIKGYEYSGLVYVADDPQEIKLYKSKSYGGYKSTILESALDSFAKTYGIMATIAANNPAALAKPEIQGHGDYVDLTSIDKKRRPGSLDYYAITMMTLILLYASLTGFWGVRSDVEQMTASRTLCAPVKRYEFLTGKVIGCIMVTIAQSAAVVLFSKFILKANWGDNPTAIIFLLTSFSIMAVSIGAGMAYLFKKGEAGSGVLNTIIPLLAFIGGSYVPLETMGPTIAKLSDLSPVKWTNSALFKVIYDNDASQLFISVAINLAVAAVFILIAAMFSKKGAGKYA